MNKNNIFSAKDALRCGLRKIEVKQGISSLIEKGLLKEVNIKGKIYYKLTDLGNKIGYHLDSDPNLRN